MTNTEQKDKVAAYDYEIATWYAKPNETVNTHELKDGDIVFSHGAIFELKDGRRFEDSFTGFGMVFGTNLILECPHYSIFPKSWQDTWTIQGNANARWLRVKKEGAE